MKINNIKYFNRVLDGILNHIRVLVIVIISFILYVTYINCKEDILSLLKILPDNSIWADLIVGIALMLISTFFNLICSKFISMKKLVSSLKIWLYNKLLYKISVSDKRRNSKISLISLFYTYDRQEIEEQKNVSTSILSFLNNHEQQSEQHCIWIEGGAYSGKTAVIMHLLRDLITENSYEELYARLDGRIYYFDMGRDDFDLNYIYNEYNDNAFKTDIVIFDNLHKLSFEQFSSKLLNMISKKRYQLLIFLTRKPEDYIYDNLKIRKMNSIMSQYGVHKELNTLSSKDVYNINNISFIPGVNFSQISDNILFHFISLLNQEAKHDIINDLRCFLTGEVNNMCFDEAFMIILCSSLFTGSFNASLAIDLNPETDMSYFKTMIKKLNEIGFLMKYPDNDKNYYFLNEEIAKYYFECGYKKTSLKSLVKKVFYYYFDYYYNRNILLSFLYSLMNEKSEHHSHILFKQIAPNVNFKNIYDDMDYLFSLEPERKVHYYKELGIICDRMGKLALARSYYLKESVEINAELFYRLVQIDHSFYDKKAELNLTHPNIYLNILAEYWDIHMKMHTGIFDFENITKLAETCSQNFDELLSYDMYDGLHLMRRIYFDVYRIFYLRGILDYKTLIQIERNISNLKVKLSQYLHEFDSYYKKFAIGLLLGYDVLFNQNIRKVYISEEEFLDLFDRYLNRKDFPLMHIWSDVCKCSIKILEDAIDEMQEIADKTYIFVKYHMYSLKMCLMDDNTSEFEVYYQEYNQFAETENIIEYKVYAILYNIRLKLIQYFNYDEIGTLNEMERDFKKKTLYDCFADIRNKLKQCSYSNQYEFIRIDLLECLFTFFNHRNKDVLEEKIKVIKKTATIYNYHRELYIVAYIENKNFQLSALDLVKIIKFYPIVAQ